ncbi:MAG: class II aldolase/adducin family protein [Bacilli bacterium]|nr:class II aldolase/adducin family protein [Bacilli bacterium]
MAYSLNEAKALIIQAGRELVKQKLVARTWGNISARISDTEFVITPSGVPYDQVNENNLVVVNIRDCSYQGNIKPSGEKKVHAAVYRLRSDVNFILHTHQNYATAVSVDEIDKDFAPVAKYALPGTKRLVKNVEEVLERNLSKDTFLLARHGALVLSKNYEDAFTKVVILENRAKQLFDKVASNKTPEEEARPYLDDYAQMFGNKNQAMEDDQEALEMVRYKNTLAARYQRKLHPMKKLDVFLQHLVYQKKYSKLKDKNK